MTAWSTHEAKRKLGEILVRAQSEGPQIITRYGMDRAVVVSLEDYQLMCVPEHEPKHGKDLQVLLLGGPKLSPENDELFFRP